MSQSKQKRLSEYTPVQRLVLAGLAFVCLGLVGAAERDIQRRPAREMRGSKLLWRVVSTNALGAVGYLRWGRLRR